MYTALQQFIMFLKNNNNSIISTVFVKKNVVILKLEI